jgi:hypothetical protein
MDLKKHPNAFCADCGTEKRYDPVHDAIYCELCNKWLEEKCDDSGCEYCAGRPEKPSSTLGFSDVG